MQNCIKNKKNLPADRSQTQPAAASKLISGVSRQQSFVSRHPFCKANLSLSSVNNLPPGLPGQQPPAFLLYRANLSLQPAITSLPASAGQYPSAPTSFHTSPITTFIHPIPNNSRQVTPAGCQYHPIFTFLFFFLLFLFSSFFLSFFLFLISSESS